MYIHSFSIIYLFVCLAACLFVCLFVYLFVFVRVCVGVFCLAVCVLLEKQQARANNANEISKCTRNTISYLKLE